MTFLQALLLGALQGLTEFLPVSSSGHLVLLQSFFGLREPTLLFDILVHVATLGAVLVIYRRDLWTVVLACPGLTSLIALHPTAANPNLTSARRLAGLVLVANIPTALIGLLFASTFEYLFATPWAVGVSLLITGAALWSSPTYLTHNQRDVDDMRIWHALVLGIIQGLAITPGISRSGSTIVVALWYGFRRELAARFSFLMAIPAILGAMLLQFNELGMVSAPQAGLLIGGMSSALVVGYLALRWLLGLLIRGNLWPFAIYCWLLGIGAILASPR